MSDKHMELDSDTIELLLTSDKIATRYLLNYVPTIIAFGTLAVMKNSPLNKYLLKYLKPTQINSKVHELIKNHLEEFVDKNENTYVLALSRPGNEYVRILIDETLVKIIQSASLTANAYYNTNSLNNKFMLAGFIEIIPDIYEEFLESCFEKQEHLATKKDTSRRKNSEQLAIPNKLASFLTVMNNKYSKDEKYCKILGRENEKDQLIRILAKATKKNAILVGEPGVGKTAIVEKLTWDIVKGNCHDKFKNKKIVELDVTSILAGTKYRGSAEERFQELIKFLENNSDCILFIDEIHTILGAGACREGELDLANALKPILARGDTQVIGATTYKEYEKYFSKDGALKRRFEKIVVEEPKTTELYDMIKNQILWLEEYHHTTISKEVVEFAIFNASCFKYETRNPDRTLDVIDKAMAVAELKNKTIVDKSDVLECFAIKRKKFEELSEDIKKEVAYHEVGHYIIQKYSPRLQNFKVLAISIMPTDNYWGVTVSEQEVATLQYTNREAYIQRIANALGGRRAEMIYTNNLNSGAADDLTHANQIAKDMVTKYGLGEGAIENRVYPYEDKNSMYTEKIITRIDYEIGKIINEATQYADSVLVAHKEEIEKLVAELVRKGMLSKIEIDSIV